MSKKKKGLMYYIDNPAEAAQKVFPFIDVKAIQEDNKKRYEQLGVNPESASSFIGSTLNPTAIAAGAGTAAAVGYGAKKFIDAYKLKRYMNKSKETLKKELFSNKSFERYKKNAIDQAGEALGERRAFIQMEELLPSKPSKDYKKKKKWFKDEVKRLEGDIQYYDTPEFKQDYKMSLDRWLDDVKFSFGKDRNSLGAYYSNYGLPRTKAPYSSGKLTKTLNDMPFWGFPGMKDMGPGRIEMLRREVSNTPLFGKFNIKDIGTTGAHEYKHAAQDLLRGYRKSTKDKIPMHWDDSLQMQGRPKAIEEARNRDLRTSIWESPGRFWDKQAKELSDWYGKEIGPWEARAKYLLKPHEIGARLSEYRATKDPRARMQLLEVLGNKKNLQDALDNVWGVAPVGLMTQYKKDK